MEAKLHKSALEKAKGFWMALLRVPSVHIQIEWPALMRDSRTCRKIKEFGSELSGTCFFFFNHIAQWLSTGFSPMLFLDDISDNDVY